MDKKLKILIIGSGGREHAIGWKIAQSKRCGQLFFAPGNAGTLSVGTNVDIQATDIDKLIDFVEKEKIDLTLALPDDPLALGIVDAFKKAGLRIFGPTQNAAKLEWSKAFSKEFMKKHKLPTARFEVHTQFDKAVLSLKTQKYPLVIKASGLALGKGVVIVNSKEEAVEVLESLLVDKKLGSAGEEVVIEEFLEGVEVSTHAFSDGKSYSIMPVTQDHKRIGDGNTGLNTGGMGTIGPVPFVTGEMLKEVESDVIAPTISHMREDGTPFEGIIYPGLMLTANGAKILEYNARFGDPETQTYMRLLETDILDIVDACIDGTLSKMKIKWHAHSACTIVLASAGYPEKSDKGKEIKGIDETEMNKNVVVFHAGTKISDGKLVTNGGRVLGVSAIGKDLHEALETAYKAIKKIQFEGMQYRRDIGEQALKLSQ
jgi:phosphoribosylamine--glycine ligase